MISREDAFAAVHKRMRKEGFILLDRPARQDQGMATVYSAADVIGEKLAAVPVVFTEPELRNLDPKHFDTTVQTKVDTAVAAYKALLP